VRHQEVKQCKEEWKLVMRKLERVASIIVNVGEICGKYNLKEEDLPAGLLDILRSLRMFVSPPITFRDSPMLKMYQRAR
jgi:hypothetical protein